MRINLQEPPFGNYKTNKEYKPWEMKPVWPASWICGSDAWKPPFVSLYRCVFALNHPQRVRVHVSADERYKLFLDNHRVGRGSDRGDVNNWFYETYEFDLDAGKHVWLARVFYFGDYRPWAQVSVSPAFILAPDNESLVECMATGVAAWKVKLISGYSFSRGDLHTGTSMGVGPEIVATGSEFNKYLSPTDTSGWISAIQASTVVHQIPLYPFERIPVLHPTFLPAQTESLFYEDQSRCIPPNSKQQWIIDFKDYFCHYVEIVVEGGGGSVIKLTYAEIPIAPCATSTHSNIACDDSIAGLQDTYCITSAPLVQSFDSLWWRAGRYVKVEIETAKELLKIKYIRFFETRYPLENNASFKCDDEKYSALIKLCFRTIQNCAHETYIDCPYYEQLMYAGDTRIQMLSTYIATIDDRLIRQSLKLFDSSRHNSLDIIVDSYPGKGKFIPPFALWYVSMIYDYSLWRGDPTFVKTLMPGVRIILNRFLSWCNSEGLLVNPPGWNFVESVSSYQYGVPPTAKDGISSILNWHFALALRQVAELDEWLNEPELAARSSRLAHQLSTTIHDKFWVPDRCLYANDTSLSSFSEHAQCLAWLSKGIPESCRESFKQSLISTTDLIRTGIYFSHYLFEAYRDFDRIDILQNRLQPWLNLNDFGYVTTPENWGETRSECHAWSAHPFYHTHASILGIRPRKFGFNEIEFRPQLGSLRHVEGSIPHRLGDISAKWIRCGAKLNGRVTFPDGLKGVIMINGCCVEAISGEDVFF